MLLGEGTESVIVGKRSGSDVAPWTWLGSPSLFFFFFESFCFVYVNFVGVRGIKKDPTFGISEGGR